MNKLKEDVLDGLRTVRRKMADSPDGVVLEAAIRFIEATPVTYDKATVVQAIACHACSILDCCDDDFDWNKKRCRKAYSNAEFLYERMILDEHDEDLEVEA